MGRRERKETATTSMKKMSYHQYMQSAASMCTTMIALAFIVLGVKKRSLAYRVFARQPDLKELLAERVVLL